MSLMDQINKGNAHIVTLQLRTGCYNVTGLIHNTKIFPKYLCSTEDMNSLRIVNGGCDRLIQAPMGPPFNTRTLPPKSELQLVSKAGQTGNVILIGCVLTRITYCMGVLIATRGKI